MGKTLLRAFASLLALVLVVVPFLGAPIVLMLALLAVIFMLGLVKASAQVMRESKTNNEHGVFRQRSTAAGLGTAYSFMHSYKKKAGYHNKGSGASRSAPRSSPDQESRYLGMMSKGTRAGVINQSGFCCSSRRRRGRAGGSRSYLHTREAPSFGYG